MVPYRDLSLENDDDDLVYEAIRTDFARLELDTPTSKETAQERDEGELERCW